MSIEADKKQNSCRYLFLKLKKINICRLMEILSVSHEKYLKGCSHDVICNCYLWKQKVEFCTKFNQLVDTVQFIQHSHT